MALKTQIIPSIISQKPSDFQKIVRILEKHAKIIQFDVMDGRFVRGKTFDHKTVKKIKTRAEKEVHLMTIDPTKDIDKYVAAGASAIIFHIEAESRKDRIIAAARKLKSQKVKFGLALNPATAINKIKPYIRLCDKVLIMTRIPGKASMPFDPRTLLKIRQLRSLKAMQGKDIEADGSMDRTTLDYARSAGANHFVIGSALFKDSRIKENIKALEKAIRR